MMNLKNFDLNLLKVLDALLRRGSTIGAGEELGLSQPAVSAALGRLRDALNDPLFVRQSNRLAPTVYALSLKEPIRQILLATGEALLGPDVVVPEALERTFYLSSTDYVGELILPPVMQRLQNIAPHVRIQLLDEIFQHSLDKLRSDKFDFAILPKFDFTNELDWQVAFNAGFKVVARPDHERLARAGLTSGTTFPIDLFCEIPRVRFAVEHEPVTKSLEDITLEKMGRSSRSIVSVPTFSAMIEICAQTDYIAIVPELMADKAAALGQVWAFPADSLIERISICLIWHSRHTNEPQHRWFRAILLEEMAKPHGQPTTENGA